MAALAAELIDEAIHHAERANSELRDLVRGILPASLTRGGLRTAVESLVSDMPVPIEVDVTAPRLPLEIETTAYFIVAEALTNVIKHAPPHARSSRSTPTAPRYRSRCATTAAAALTPLTEPASLDCLTGSRRAMAPSR